MQPELNLQKERSNHIEEICAREDLSQLIDSMGLGVVVQSVEGKIVTVNRSAEQIMGLSSKELLGRNLTDSIWKLIQEDGSILEEDQQPATIALQTGDIVSNKVMGIYDQKKKQYHWVRATAKPEFLAGEDKPNQVSTILLDITEQKQLEHKLNERTKELKAFYSLSTIADAEDVTLDELYQHVIEFLPKSWQYSEVACGRITIDDSEYITENFRESQWVQSTSIQIGGTMIGLIEICYLEERPQADEGPFLCEERLLLESVAARIGRIAERKQAENELRENNSRLELAMQSANMAWWEMDITNGNVKFDKRKTDMLGYPPENFKHYNDFVALVHPEDSDKAMNAMQRHIDGLADKYEVEYRILTESNVYKWFYDIGSIVKKDSKGMPLYVTGLVIDITERKRAEADRKKVEEKLSSSEYRNKTIVDAIPDLLFRVKQDGTFLDYSAKSTDRLYAPPEVFIGRNIADVLPADIAGQSLEAIHQAFDQNTLQTFEYAMTMNGTVMLFEGRVVSNLNEDEAVMIIRDITERKKMELSLQHQLMEFETINRLSSAMRAGKNLKELLCILLKETLDIVNSTDGCILLLDPIDNYLKLVEGSLWFQTRKGMAINIDNGIVGHIFKTKEPYISVDLQKDEFISDKMRGFIPPQSSGTFLPIRSEAGTIGILMVLFPLSHVINENEVRLLAIISQLGAIAISRSRLHDQVELSNADLKEEIHQKVIAQERLATEKELLSTTLMSIADGVIVTDNKGLILLFNQAAESMTDFALNEVVKKPVNGIFKLHFSDTLDLIPDVINFLLDLETAKHKHLTQKSPVMITKNGRKILVSTSIRSIKSTEEITTGYVIVFQDINEKQKADAQNMLSQKMEAIGQLAAGIAHEINTPIQYVGDNIKFLGKAYLKYSEVLAVYQQSFLGHLETNITQADIDQLEEIASKKKLPYYASEIPKAIEEALDGTERVRKIVLAMREFSHSSEKEKKLADINHGIETTIVISRNEWKYCAELETDLDPALPLVHCRVDEINQVVLNMIVNAAQAIQENRPEGSEQMGKILISTRSKENMILITIHDSGCGIPIGIRGRVFDPFFTTKGVGKGTGQGLSMAHNIIVKKHHGLITLDSEVDKGTTFTIELPVNASAAGGK